MRRRGQSTLEFTFTLLVIFLLAYGLIRVLRWVGIDTAERRWAAERSFTEGSTATDQLSGTEFYRGQRINPQYKGGY